MNRECGAKAKTNSRQPCRRFAMPNGRCHLHGGKSTGAKTASGKLRQKMAPWRHGMRSQEMLCEQKLFREKIKSYKNFL